MESLQFSLHAQDESVIPFSQPKATISSSDLPLEILEWLKSTGINWQPNQGRLHLEADHATAGAILLDLPGQLADLDQGRRAQGGSDSSGSRPAIHPHDTGAALTAYWGHLKSLPYAERTRWNYFKAFAQFLDAFPGRALGSLQASEVEQWLEQRAHSNQFTSASTNTLINAIQLHFKMEAGNPQFTLKRPKRKSAPPATISREEVQRMVQVTTNAKHRLVLLLVYAAGLRMQELLALRREDLDVEQLKLRIPGKVGRKRRSARVLPLPDSLSQPIKAYFASHNPAQWLFEGIRRGTPYSDRSAQALVQQAAQRAGIKQAVSMQMLRSTYAAHQIKAGVGVGMLQDLMGHDSIRTTARFAMARTLPRPVSPADGLQF